MRSYYSYINERDAYVADCDRATYKGVAIKTITLLLITIAVAVATAYMLPTLLAEYFVGFYYTLFISIFVGFICVIVGRLSDRCAKVCSIIYSVCEGLLLGTITCIVNEFYPGAGTLAIFATLVIFAVMLTLYSFGILKAGMIRMVLLGIVLSLISLVIFDLIFILATGGYESYGIIMAIQVFLLFYGIITLTFNFAEADMVVKSGCPKQAEWSVALGLTVSLIYIYIYILRILLLAASRRR